MTISKNITETFNKKQECYEALVIRAKQMKGTDFAIIAPNSGSEKTVEIPEGLHALGLEMRFYELNEKGNSVCRTKTIYGLFKDYE